MVQCPMTGEDEELANDMMMSTMLGAKAGKGKMSKGMAGGMEGAMTAMSAEEKLINPHTVSSRFHITCYFINMPSTELFITLFLCRFRHNTI